MRWRLSRPHTRPGGSSETGVEPIQRTVKPNCPELAPDNMDWDASWGRTSHRASPGPLAPGPQPSPADFPKHVSRGNPSSTRSLASLSSSPRAPARPHPAKPQGDGPSSDARTSPGHSRKRSHVNAERRVSQTHPSWLPLQRCLTPQHHEAFVQEHTRFHS